MTATRYNALLYVPFQLERLLLFGLLTCVVSLTSVLVVLPLRAVADAATSLSCGIRSMTGRAAAPQEVCSSIACFQVHIICTPCVVSAPGWVEWPAAV